jgi:hypothetical protein
MSSRARGSVTQTVRVIVVHGIGSQKLGSTAARWADSLVRFGRAAGYEPDVLTATLTTDPARTALRLAPPVTIPLSPPPDVEIAIEEAYWAESFPEPSVGRVLRFLLTVAPVLAITQSILIWRSRGELWPGNPEPEPAASTGPPRRPTTSAAVQATGHAVAQVAPLALGILALGLAAPVIAVLLLLLLLGASLPIPAVRALVGKTLGWLSTSIGDAYLFVADPVNRAAMERRLADRLEEKQSVPPLKRTVVLAHSQGAALAYRALRTMKREDRPAALITVGSGVGRLREVGLLQTLPWYLTPLFVAIVATAATGLALWDWVASPPLLGVALALGLVVWRICADWLDEGQAAEKSQTGHARSSLLKPIDGVSWLDIWASFDPVPNGRSVRDNGDASYQLARVAGEQSLVRDHVRYDLDWDQTMPLVFSRLLQPSRDQPMDYVGVRPPGPGDAGPERLKRIPLTTRDWTGLGLRTVPVAVVGVLLALWRDELFAIGHWLRTAPPGFLDSTVDAVFVPLRTLSDFLEATWFRAPRPQALLGFLALLALGVVGSVLTRRVLTFFQRRETTKWLAGGGAQPGRTGPRWKKRQWRAAFAGVALAAAVVPGFLAWASQESHWTAAQTVEAYLTAVAEDDTRALCEVTTSAVTARPFDESGSPDPCESDEKDALDVLRTCADGRKAVGGLEEEAFTISSRGKVEVTWAPEVEGACEDPAHWLAMPTQVAFEEGRWRVSDVTDPPT